MFLVAVDHRAMVEAIEALERYRFVVSRQRAFVETIEQAADALSL